MSKPCECGHPTPEQFRKDHPSGSVLKADVEYSNSHRKQHNLWIAKTLRSSMDGVEFGHDG